MLLFINKRLSLWRSIFILLIYFTPTFSRAHLVDFMPHIFINTPVESFHTLISSATLIIAQAWKHRSKKDSVKSNRPQDSNNQNSSTKHFDSFFRPKETKLSNGINSKKSFNTNIVVDEIDCPPATLPNNQTQNNYSKKTQKKLPQRKSNRKKFKINQKPKKTITALHALYKVFKKFNIQSIDLRDETKVNTRIISITTNNAITDIDTLYSFERVNNTTLERLEEPIRLLHLVLSKPEWLINNNNQLSSDQLKKSQYLLIKTLLMLGADINCNDISYGTPLHHAAIKGLYDICSLFIEKDGACTSQSAAINGISYTPLEYLLYKAPNLNTSQYFAQKDIENASLQQQYSAIAQLLIESGAPRISKLQNKSSYNQTVWNIIYSANVNEQNQTLFSELMRHMKGIKINPTIRWQATKTNHTLVKNNSTEKKLPLKL